MTKPVIVVLDQANTTGAMDQGQEVGPAASPGTAEPPAAPPRPAAPAKHAQTSPPGLSHSREHRCEWSWSRNKVGSIQRSRLASLGSMDPQTSEQLTWGNVQHLIYT
jgi:hypothetical protein